MRKIVVILYFLTGALLTQSQSRYYPVDDGHSQVKFIGHLGGMMDVEGSFGKFSGYIKFDENRPEETSVTLFIDPTSVASGNHWRDAHLKNEEFLDADRYTQILFQSREVEIQDGKLNVAGNLSLKGVTSTITIPVTHEYGPSPDPWGNIRIGFSAKMLFSRENMNLGPKEGFWGNSIADEFEMEFTLSASLPNMDIISHLNESPLKEIYTLAENLDEQAVRTALLELQEKGELESWKIQHMAMKLDQQDNSEAALLVYRLNASFFKEEGTVLSMLALAYFERKAYTEAAQYAREAIAINPADTLALELLKSWTISLIRFG